MMSKWRHRLVAPTSVLGLLGMLAVATSALAADIPATANSLNNHVWSRFNPIGSLPNTNGTQIATGNFSHASDGTLLTIPVGPSFTVTKISGATSNTNYISTIGQSGYAPGSAPATGTGFPSPVPEQHEVSPSSTTTPKVMRYQFSSALPTGSIVWSLDIDQGSESLTAEFFSCAGTRINPSGFDAYLLSTTNLPTRSFSATNVVFTSSVVTNVSNPTLGIIIRSSDVCRIDLSFIGNLGGHDAFFSIPRPLVTLVKALGTNRVVDTNQFTMQIRNSGDAVVSRTAGSTTAGTGAAVTAGTGTTRATPVNDNATYTLTEVAAGTTTLSDYASSIACTNALAGSSTVLPSGTGQTFSVTPLNLLDNITCTLTNSAKPRLTITKISNGGIGTFSFSGDNGIANHDITTAAAGIGVAGATQVLTSASTATTVDETAPLPAGFKLTSIACTGMGTGGTATPTVNGVNGGSVLLDAAATALGSTIACTFTNDPLTADLSISKTNTPTSGDSDLPGDTLLSGSQTTYTVVARNEGVDAASDAIVRDQPTAGLSGCTVTCPAEALTGGAACPATPADLLTTDGVEIPVFPADSSVTFLVHCTVD